MSEVTTPIDRQKVEPTQPKAKRSHKAKAKPPATVKAWSSLELAALQQKLTEVASGIGQLTTMIADVQGALDAHTELLARADQTAAQLHLARQHAAALHHSLSPKPTPKA